MFIGEGLLMLWEMQNLSMCMVESSFVFCSDKLPWYAILQQNIPSLSCGRTRVANNNKMKYKGRNQIYVLLLETRYSTYLLYLIFLSYLSYYLFHISFSRNKMCTYGTPSTIFHAEQHMTSTMHIEWQLDTASPMFSTIKHWQDKLKLCHLQPLLCVLWYTEQHNMNIFKDQEWVMRVSSYLHL